MNSKVISKLKRTIKFPVIRSADVMYTVRRIGVASILPVLMTSCSVFRPIPDSTKSDVSGSAISSVVILPPENKPTQIEIVWLSPSPADEEIQSIGGKVEIKIRINSRQPIELDQIDIYVNNKPIEGGKADEVSLLKRPEYLDQVLTMQVPIETGQNAVQVVVTQDAENRFFAERVIEKNNEGISVRSASVSGPTRVIWVKPDLFSLSGQMYSTGARTLEFRLNIVSPEQIEIEKIKILFNRRYLKPGPEAHLRGTMGNYAFVDVIELDESVDFNELGLVVQTSSGTVESELLKINYSPVRPNIYMLAIGPKLNLKYAYKDARDFAELFARQTSQTYRLFKSVQIDTLIGENARTNEIRGMIETIKTKFRTGQISEDDIVIVFISSHGFIDERGDFRIQGNDYSPERRNSSSVSYKNDILLHLESIPCRKVLFIDACHSGGARANAADILSALHDLKSTPPGFAILTSSSENEESYEDIRWQNGAFTEAILKGLRDGEADTDGNSIVTLLELESYLKETVPGMVRNVKNKGQNPRLTRNDIGDLPIYIIQK